MMKRREVSFVYLTRKGTIPFLTRENQANLDLSSLQITLGDLFTISEVLKKAKASGISLRKFFGFEESRTTFITPIDSRTRRIRGSSKMHSVDVFGDSFIPVTNNDVLSLAALAEPDYFVALTEETGWKKGSSVISEEEDQKKSNKRNLNKTRLFIEETIKYKKENECKWEVLAPFIGGNFPKLRAKSLAHILENVEKLGGLAFYSSSCANEETRDEILNTARESLVSGPFEDKVKLFHSKGSPVDILYGVSKGFNTFDTNFPFSAAETNYSWTLDTEEWRNRASKAKESPLDDLEINAHLLKMLKDQSVFLNLAHLEPKENRDMHFTLGERCKCSTCAQGFTKAYIHHLIDCREMLATILLTIHNVHQMNEFQNYLNSENFRNNQKGHWMTFGYRV